MPNYKPAACNAAEKNYLKRDFARCFSLIRTNLQHQVVANPNDPPPTALGPADIQSAYNLPSGGAGMTIAVVDAYGYSSAESDLATFRSYYGLPACTTANGCFTKLDQNGGTNYPPDDSGWALESALDLDAVSSACPQCNIMLVEGNDNSLDNLGTAVDTAVAQGAVAVSNSYGVAGETPDELSYDHYYNHPGVAVTASTGDTGDVTNWPATNPNVAAIGGTTLTQDSSQRGWGETAWADGGSGCSLYEPHPDYQNGIDTNCPNNKAIADISADADPNTGLAVYDTLGYSGWLQVGGTSLSSPLVAAMYGLAGTPVPGTYPVTYPYNDPNKANNLNDVTMGSNGSCGNVLCTAGPGWDGPTGLGTPNGVNALTSGPHGDIAGTVKSAATGKPIRGATIAAKDTASGSTYTATTNGKGHYDLAVATGTYNVTASKFGYASKTVHGVVVTENQTIRENFTLTRVPSNSLSGTVTDGSGHGWPLYAKITIDGYPHGAVFTNPYTGRYSLSLPAGKYTMHVSTVDMPGYQTADVTVKMGNADMQRNIKLKVDGSTCLAPGYSYKYNGTGTDFEGWTDHNPQGGWKVTDPQNYGYTWEFDDPGNRGNLTGGSGNFAIVDSDHWGPGTQENTSLVSPVTDMSNQTSPEVGFDTYYQSYFNSVADVDLSVNGGSTWTNVWEATTSNVQGHVDVPIPQAAGKSQVEVRFHYTGQWAYYWELDNVFIGNRSCAPNHGGLVEGIVRDNNTHMPINGAKVVSKVHPDEFGVSMATPDDANLSDGYYWLFSSHTGNTKFTASDGKYKPVTATVNVQPDYVTQKNWLLKAGHITVKPRGISVTEILGQTKTAHVRFTNDGTSPVHVTLSEQNGGFTPLNGKHQATPGAPLTRIKGHFSFGAFASHGHGTPAPGTVQLKHHTVQLKNPTPNDPPWTDIADYPTPIMDNAAAYNDGKVYSVAGFDGAANTAASYVYDSSAQSWSSIADLPQALEAPSGAFVNGKLYSVGGWDATGNASSVVYAYDPAADSWTQVADLPESVSAAGVAAVNGQLYVVGGCTTANCGPASTKVYSYDPGSDSWTQHADYPIGVAFLACGGANGQLVCAGGVNPDTSVGTKSTYTYDPGSDSWTQDADMPYDNWAMAYSGSGGKLQVAAGIVGGAVSNQAAEFDPVANSWAALPNANNAEYRGAGSCGFYKVGGSTGGFSPAPFAEQLPGYDQCASAADVPWLSENPSDFTVAPGKTVTVAVTMDSSQVSQPGDYTAKLGVQTDSPYQVQPIDVTMHVLAPRSWGKISGVVTDAATGNPLPGATVQICTMFDRRTGQCGPVTYTLKTDANGYYQLWLNEGYDPLEVIAAKDGYQPKVQISKVRAGQTTMLNFALNKS
ncbi:MAG: carboxypeptidase regulatory-like domain-containing protein [Nocardioidaceae bacterium]